MLNFQSLKEYIIAISREKEIPEEKIWGALEDSLAAAFKKEKGLKDYTIKAKIDFENNNLDFYIVKNVVEDDKEIKGEKQIKISEARKINPEINVGEDLYIKIEEDANFKDEFSRIAAQVAKQVITQRLREIEKEIVYEEFKKKENEIVSGTIQKIEPKVIYVDLGKTLGTMFVSESIPNEKYRIGLRFRFYVYAVEKTPRGVEVYLSRSHPNFLKKLFEAEIPEINEGIVEIKAIAREPGLRSKVAVVSHKENIDPIGACVGPKGARILTIINELNGEKIDIVLWDPDPEKFVANAIAPAKVVETKILEKRTIQVFVEEEQLSLAIGKNGQNARLAAKLTGWRIDIRSISRPQEEIEFGIAEA
jgi:N utilization substance protein A